MLLVMYHQEKLLYRQLNNLFPNFQVTAKCSQRLHTAHKNIRDGPSMKLLVLNHFSFMGHHIRGGGNLQSSSPVNSGGCLTLFIPSGIVSGASQ